MSVQRLTDEQIAARLAFHPAAPRYAAREDKTMNERVDTKALEIMLLDLDDKACTLGRILTELLDYRARSATHAATHPERLSDTWVDHRLAELATPPDSVCYRPYVEKRERDALLEIQQRRARDLSPGDIAVVQMWYAMAREAGNHNSVEAEIIDLLLGAHGITLGGRS